MKAKACNIVEVFNAAQAIYWPQENGEMRRLKPGFYIESTDNEGEPIFIPVGAIWKFHTPNSKGELEYHFEFPEYFGGYESLADTTCDELLQIVPDGEAFDREIMPWDADEPYDFGPDDELWS